MTHLVRHFTGLTSSTAPSADTMIGQNSGVRRMVGSLLRQLPSLKQKSGCIVIRGTVLGRLGEFGTTRSFVWIDADDVQTGASMKSEQPRIPQMGLT